MKVEYGNGKTKFGPGVNIELEGVDVAVAIDAYLVSQGVHVSGPRTIQINGELCSEGRVYVDPSGFVIFKGRKYDGRGPGEGEDQREECEHRQIIQRRDKGDWGAYTGPTWVCVDCGTSIHVEE